MDAAATSTSPTATNNQVARSRPGRHHHGFRRHRDGRVHRRPRPGHVGRAELPVGRAGRPVRADVFISDGNTNVVRKVEPRAGSSPRSPATGLVGYSGDHGPATAAELDDPTGHRRGRLGEPLHRRQSELRGPPGRHDRDHHDGRRERHVEWPVGRRRAGHRGPAQRPVRGRRGQPGQPVHRRLRRATACARSPRPAGSSRPTRGPAAPREHRERRAGVGRPAQGGRLRSGST